MKAVNFERVQHWFDCKEARWAQNVSQLRVFVGVTALQVKKDNCWKNHNSVKTNALVVLSFYNL